MERKGEARTHRESRERHREVAEGSVTTVPNKTKQNKTKQQKIHATLLEKNT